MARGWNLDVTILEMNSYFDTLIRKFDFDRKSDGCRLKAEGPVMAFFLLSPTFQTYLVQSS